MRVGLARADLVRLGGRSAERAVVVVRVARFAVPGSPGLEQVKSAGQLPALFGQLVDESQRAGAVGSRGQQRFALEVAQALGQRVRRDSLDALGELAETGRAIEQRGDDLERPAVADAGERLGQGGSAGTAGDRSASIATV